MKTTMCLCLALLAAAAAHGAEEPLPVYDVPKLGDITIDGKADDWADRGFRVDMLLPEYGRPRPEADFNPRFRLGWNGKGLLLLAIVRDNEAVEAESALRLYSRDGVEVFLAPKRGVRQWCQWVIAPGLAADQPKLRWHLHDHRGDAALKKHPADIVAARTRTKTGYVLEALLPWAALAIEPKTGREVAVQVWFNDADRGTRTYAALWHPASDTSRNPDSMHRVRLSGAAAPPMDVRLHGRHGFERPRTVLTALAPGNQAGRTVDVTVAGKTAARGRLKATPDGWATAEMQLPLPPVGKPYGPVTLRKEGRDCDRISLPDADPQRAEIIGRRGPAARRCVFGGKRFPKVAFEYPDYADALLGPHGVKTTYYDAGYNVVTSAERPGRYGAVVEIVTASGGTFRRFLTLFRLRGPVRWRDMDVDANLSLPDQVGVDPKALAKHREAVSDFLKGQFVGSLGRDDGAAKLLAGISETPPDAPPVVRRTSIWSRDERWWFGLKQKLGLIETRHLLFLPRDYDKDPKRKWPLVLFLHGAGERGDDLEMVKGHGPPKLAAGGRDFPFVLVAPQCPAGGWGWVPAELAALLDAIEKKYRVDPDRVYCTGLSMGGGGTWRVACEYPKRFAAIAPICGGGDPRDVERIKHVPTWAFHGAKDDTVPLKRMQDMVDALRKAGGKVALTVYPDVGHGSWTRTYDNEAFYRWLLSNQRGRPAVMPKAE